LTMTHFYLLWNNMTCKSNSRSHLLLSTSRVFLIPAVSAEAAGTLLLLLRNRHDSDGDGVELSLN
jgi:hypothetical protein